MEEQKGRENDENKGENEETNKKNSMAEEKSPKTKSTVEIQHVSADVVYPDVHDSLMVHITKKLSVKKVPKPLLVLDLDETLVSAAQVTMEEKLEPGSKELFFDEFIPRQRLFLKIRPGTKWFIKEMHKSFNIVVYSLGNKKYVQTIIRLIDPAGIFINRDGCYFPNDEERQKREKTLKKIRQSLAEHFAVILDDMVPVWAKDGIQNCIPSKKYIPFKEKIQPMKYNRMSVLGKQEDELELEHLELYEEKHEEKKERNQLRLVASGLKRLASAYEEKRKMHPNEKNKWDMRKIIKEERKKVLSGTTLRLIETVSTSLCL